MISIFAFLDTLRLAKLIEGALATIGGFIVGYVLAIVLGWIFDKFLIKRRSPEFLHKVIRLIFGLAIAILVAVYFFGGGGGGGGTGENNSEGTSSQVQGQPDPSDPTVVPPSTLQPTDPAGLHVRITILGGNEVKDERFYQVDDDPTPHALPDIKSRILAKKEVSSGALILEVLFSRQFTLPQDHPAVTQLTSWARDRAGVTVTFPAEMP